MKMEKDEPAMAPVEFWEDRYEAASAETSGRPTTVLEKFVKDRPVGHALELGCGKGDDAVWLAKQGWFVTALDISQAAIDIARKNAERNNVAEKINFKVCDLTKDFPEGDYDLVTAQFLESPFEFPRERILNHAAKHVCAAGMLLVTTHGSVPPWSETQWETDFPTPEEALVALNLDLTDWTRIFVENFSRIGQKPGSKPGKLIDTVIALERNR